VSVADEFDKALNQGLVGLSIDEWAITKVREQALVGLSANEAFESITEILKLAGDQTDEYAFSSCCWFAMDLARRSDTTEPPSGAADALVSLGPVAAKFDAVEELRKIASWYRLTI
jgi:hypothetical protein